jgi:phosphonoacetaldehyde hydrolase
MKKISAIILDWAGTTVDYGSFAPVDAFISAFGELGITPTINETRAPMGLQKRAHVEKMLSGERISGLWHEKYGRKYNQEDIDKIYNKFESSLFTVLHKYTDIIRGVLETVKEIKSMGIKIGSTTGYTQEMMNIVAPAAKERGYSPDCIICPDEVGGIGRPFPYMLWRNIEKIGVDSINQVIKIGDTEADMQEGKNAGCICVGVIRGSSMLGLNQEETANLNENKKIELFKNVKLEYFKSGADFVIEDITHILKLIEIISFQN